MILALKLYLIVGELMACIGLMFIDAFRRRLFANGVARGCLVLLLFILTWPMVLKKVFA